MLAVSCSTEESFSDEVAGDGKVKVSIGQSMKIKTRTTVAEDGYTAIWEGDDRIAVWAQGSDGVFDLTGERFLLYRYTTAMSKAIFTSYITPLADDTYTYYAVYPLPTAVNGTQATFALSATQSGESFVGDCDIMVSAPIQAAALVEDEVNSLDFRFSHKMHAMRFDIPSDGNLMGMTVDKIEFTFPTNVVGDVTVDITNPDAEPVLTNGSNKLTLNLPNGAEAGDTLWAMIFPTELSGNITYKAYSGQYVSVEGTLEVSKVAQAQHMTRKEFQIPELYRLTTITLKVVESNLGEDFNTMTILDSSGNTMGSFSKNSNDVYEFKIEGEYDVTPLRGQTFTARYDSNNAVIDYQFTMPSNMLAYTQTSVDLKVPYLLYEDFSAAGATAHDDDYTAGANEDRNLTGYLLDGYMPRNGWNASRFQLSAGNRIRINVRYQSGAWIVGRYCGRLDTPAIGYLKSNNVNLKVTYDIGCTVSVGYNTDDTNNAKTFYILGKHTNADTSAIKGQNQSDISGQCTTIFESVRYTNNNMVSFVSVLPETVTKTVSGCGPSTRFVWWACTDRDSSVIAANSVAYFYIDNIKVQIAN